MGINFLITVVVSLHFYLEINIMSQQAFHKMVVKFNRLSEGDPQKDRLRLIIEKEVASRGLKPANPTFSLA